MRRVKFVVNVDNQLDLVFYGFVDVSLCFFFGSRVHGMMLTIKRARLALPK